MVCKVVPGIADSTGRRRDCALAVGWKHLLLPLLISLHAKRLLRHESYSKYVRIARATSVKLIADDATLMDHWQYYVLVVDRGHLLAKKKNADKVYAPNSCTCSFFFTMANV